jgi:hypothetical protein
MKTSGIERSWGAIALVGALLVAHTAAVVSMLDAPEKLSVVHNLAGWGGSLIGVIGTVSAALAFSRGDYLRKVWGWFAVGAVLLLVGNAMRSAWDVVAPGRPFSESGLLVYRTAVVVGVNVASAWALLLLSQTYRQSGLQPPSSWRANALWALTAVLALAVIGKPLSDNVHRVLGETGAPAFVAVTAIASTLGDLTTVILVVPLLRVAYMLRGGRLAWVWWMMGASGAAWLVYDAREWIATALPGDPARNLELVLVVRSLAMGLKGVSGLLQRAALAPQPVPAEAAPVSVPSATP